jgi:hypothetical protein
MNSEKRNIVDVCPEKNKSFVSPSEPERSHIKGSRRTNIPGGASSGTKYIVSVRSKSIIEYAKHPATTRDGYFKTTTTPMIEHKYIMIKVGYVRSIAVNASNIGSASVTPARVSVIGRYEVMTKVAAVISTNTNIAHAAKFFFAKAVRHANLTSLKNTEGEFIQNSFLSFEFQSQLIIFEIISNFSNAIFVIKKTALKYVAEIFLYSVSKIRKIAV